MPITIIQQQRRARELGRIRLGQKGDKGQPQKLKTFRLTTQSKALLDRAAELYGGDVKEWTPRGGAQQWELLTTAKRIPIFVPPQPVSQWMETWTGGGCVHRCDGETNMLTGEACDPEDPDHLNAKPTTRLKVVLCELEGIGVWRLESHGWNAAVELPDAADFLAQAGGYIEGFIALEERVTKSIVDGQAKTNRFVVPIVEVNVTPAQLMAGKGRVAAPAVDGPVAPAPRELGTSDGYGATALPTPDDIAGAADLDMLGVMWQALEDAGAHTEETNAAGNKRAAELQAAAPADPPPDESPVAPPEQTDDDPAAADAAWQRVLKAGGQLDPPMTLGDVAADFEQQHSIPVSGATAKQLTDYAVQLEGAQS